MPSRSSHSTAGGTPAAVTEALASVMATEWSRIVATLVNAVGDLDLAEDSVQEAVEAALTSWPDDGVPRNPAAWIVTVARRRAIDRIRRARTGERKAELLGRLESRMPEEHDSWEDDSLLRDDQLRLLFGCCHPALAVEAQVALTLRSVGGLQTPEIARAFLVPEPTMAQRLVRAKKKISVAGIPFVIPEDQHLLERLSTVRSVIYLIFNEGYQAGAGDQLQRIDLSEEAIRLARLLVDLTPDDSESLGLLALFLLIQARSEARTDDAGDLVLLEDQDRRRWDRDRIEEGTSVLDRAVRLARPGPYQVQAAINALHDGAAAAADTDWAQIEQLYRRLLTFGRTAVVALNHAVAVAMASGPTAGLALLDDAGLSDELDRYSHFHSARADLHRRAGDAVASRAAYERAIELSDSEPEQRFLTKRLAAL